MSILDNQIERLALDSNQVGSAIALLPDQLTQVLQDINQLPKLKLNQTINKIVLNGMGGSNLGARLIASALSEQLTIPLIIEPGYSVPGYVDAQTLYIVSTYSGTTEEPLSVISQVQSQGGQLAVITANHPSNPLVDLANQHNWPAYLFNPQHNPSGQPRLGLGYAIFGLLGLLSRLDLFNFDTAQAKQLIDQLKQINQQWLPEQLTTDNDAKQLAQQLQDRQIWLVGPDCLTGNLHILRNQINESGKHLANYLTVPELNHYAMEGLSFPISVPETVAILSFKLAGLSARLDKRLNLTDTVFEQNKLPVFQYRAQSTNRLGQALEILAFGSWLSYYLGLLHGVDPVKIPWVDLFKAKLA